MEKAESEREFWKGRRVLVTGHTGFKGGWLATWLLEAGAVVTGYALPPERPLSYFESCGLSALMHSLYGDIRDADALKAEVSAASPDVVFHLAAQSLVRRSYGSPAETFATNVMGTVNLLEAVRATPSVRAVVVVTSDKCYREADRALGYDEGDALGGRDPYSASKACAEIVAASYGASFFNRAKRVVGLATVRAGNVIGGGDWAEDRLVPDAIRALASSRPLMVRNPRSIRPWQHVLEPLSGYLVLGRRLYDEPERYAGPWNFGPRPADMVSVAELAEMIVQSWGEGCWQVLPDQTSALYEAPKLTLNSAKVKSELGWEPRLNLHEALSMTVRWYKAACSRPQCSMHDLSREQIRRYESLAGATSPHEEADRADG